MTELHGVFEKLLCDLGAFAYMDVGKGRGHYGRPALSWHKHFPVQKQDAEASRELFLRFDSFVKT